MLAERKRIQLAKQGAVNKGTAPKKLKPAPPKPEWNNYLTDDNRFKADQEKLLLKKKLLVSQNNIFVSNGDVSLRIRPKAKPVQAVSSAPVIVSVSPPAKKTPTKKEINALDLIISAKDKEIRQKNVVSPSVNKFERSRSANRTTREVKRDTEIRYMGKENWSLENERADGNQIAVDWMGRSASDVNAAHAKELSARRREFLLADTQSLPVNVIQSHISVESKSNSTTKPNKSIRNPSPAKHSTSMHNSSPAQSASTSSSPAKRSAKNITSDKDYDLVYVADEIRSLFAELKYYEELSGRRSILDTREELDAMMQDEALLDPQSHKPVMRYLVQLVCQSMTYLLKSEVDLQDERKRYETLSAKFESLNALLAPDSVVPNIADFRHVTASEQSAHSAQLESSGIAFELHDLYPQPSWRSMSGDVPAQPLQSSAELDDDYVSMNSSSALRSLAQQYAQDDYYPLPGDRDEERHSALYTSLEGAGIRAYPNAQFTSTPARFQEKVSASATMAAGKVSKLAANPVPGTALATPAGQKVPHHGYNSVSSTCSTPPMSLLHKKYVYSTAGIPPHHAQESGHKQTHTHVTSPAPYVDAYASYLHAPVSAPIAPKAIQPSASVAALSTPTKGNAVTSQAAASAVLLGQADAQFTETDDGAMSAGLSRLDELIRYSKTIANSSYTAGDEFSTIARLTDNFASYSTKTAAGVDDSILSSPGPVQRLGGAGNQAVQAPRAPAEASQMYQHMYSSDSEFSLPPPPPPAHHSAVGFSADHAKVVLRQPATATASRMQLQQQKQQLENPTQLSNAHSSSTVTPSLSQAAMSGTSPSDWLFGSFTAKAAPSSASQATSASLPITPEVVFSPPTSAQQVVGMVTPSRDFIKVQVPAPQPTVNQKTGAINTKVRSPATRDLFNQMGSGESTSQRAGFNAEYDSADETVDRLADQTSNLFAPDASPVPAPRAAVPTYLLDQKQQQHKGASTSKLVQSTIVHRHASPSTRTVQKKVTVLTPRTQQEQASIIVPHSTVPSPQSAPVHPYASANNSLAHKTYQEKLHSLQNEVQSHSNDSTPKLSRWAPPALVLDATSGSY